MEQSAYDSIAPWYDKTVSTMIESGLRIDRLIEQQPDHNEVVSHEGYRL